MDRKITAIAIDDEPLGLEVLQRFAAKIPNLELAAVFNNPIDALSWLSSHRADLVFLDIQMPDLTGFELLKSLSAVPQVIFVSAHPEYAVDSYEYEAVDYLLKPVTFDRFLKAVNRAYQKLASQPNERDNDTETIFIKSDTRYFRVRISDIQYVEGMRDYVAVHTADQRILTLMNMGKMEALLPEDRFMRIHKSFIIGLEHIEMVQHHKVLIGEKELPVSNTYREGFQKYIEGRNL